MHIWNASSLVKKIYDTKNKPYNFKKKKIEPGVYCTWQGGSLAIYFLGQVNTTIKLQTVELSDDRFQAGVSTIETRFFAQDVFRTAPFTKVHFL